MGRLAKGLISAPGSRFTAGTGNELAPLAVLRVYRGRFPGKKKELQFHSPSLAPTPLLKSYPNCDAIFLSKFQAGFPRWVWASLVVQTVKNPPAMRETRVRSLGLEDPLETGTGYPLRYSCLENPMGRGA